MSLVPGTVGHQWVTWLVQETTRLLLGPHGVTKITTLRLNRRNEVINHIRTVPKPKMFTIYGWKCRAAKRSFLVFWVTFPYKQIQVRT
jgi:hypothetical protein